jgi:hypothetical protein
MGDEQNLVHSPTGSPVHLYSYLCMYQPSIHMRKFLFILFPVILMTACTQQKPLTPAEAKEIAKEAYIYGFPMVMNYKTMWAYTINSASPEFKGGFNEIGCEARVYTPQDKAVVTPNSDTPYCMFWADLNREPLVITVPEIAPDRYYSFQLIDLYTHNFAYIGTLTTGNDAGSFLITKADWQGEVPENIEAVFPCETDLFFVIVRVQLFDAGDLDHVKRIQESFGFTGLAEYLGETPPPASGEIIFPVWNEGDQFTINAFTYIDFLMNLTETEPSEKDLRERFKKLRIGDDDVFNPDAFQEEIRTAIEEGVQEGIAEIEDFIATIATDPLSSAKIFGTREFLTESAMNNYQLDNFYLLRAAAAQRGLFGHSGEEAVYPTYLFEAQGVPFNAAENNYVLVFPKDALPPVKSFWSLTMYDAKTQLLVDNPIDRYLINSTMTNDFVYGKDGSLTLYVQQHSPGKALEANWLPAPNGPFYCVLRLYGPEESVLNGTWSSPKMIKNQ